jgi:hypothetical protein
MGMRGRKIGIVALARKLVIALWRFVEEGGADVASLPFQDRRRRTLAQIKRVLALAAERNSNTRGTKSALAQ